MAKEITPTQLDCFTGQLRKQIPNILQGAQLVAAVSAKALIKTRIFNDGKNANESPISYPSPKGTRTGAYSTGHAKTRRKASRQTGHVDLQLTDRLFNSIQVINGPKGPFLGILPGSRSDGGTNRKLAAILEEKYKQDIFEPSKGELKLILKSAEKQAADEFEKIVMRCL